MTVSDPGHIRDVAQRIREASSAEVLADIKAVGTAQRPAWLQEASRAMALRYAGASALRGVKEGVAPDFGVDETIVFAVGTPVFLVKGNAIDLQSARIEAKAWQRILTDKAALLNGLMASIGRIDVANFDRDFVGTGWVIDAGLIVTNRHVALMFAEASGVGFKFKTGFDARNPIGVQIDFLEEFGGAGADETPIERVVWVAPDNGPDVAFLKLADRSAPSTRRKLDLASQPPPAKLPVAVVGYPASDSRFSDQELARKIFGGIFDKKRVAVGNLLGVGDNAITHSCATLGGNSGSPVIDLAEGVVVGLHYRGVEFVENDAVPAATLRRCLNRARGLLEGSGGFDMGSDTKGEVRAGAALTFTVPIKITVEIDGAGAQAAIAVPIAAPAAAAAASPAAAKPGTVDRQRVLDAVRKARALLANREDVVAIKPGYRFENGQITDERAVVISVRKKVEKGALESRGVIALPDYIDGVRTDVTVASVADLLGADGALEAAPPSWRTSYAPRPDLPLARRKAKMKFVVHSGPDASWSQLGPFLSRTRKSLVVAMYDVGAPQVVDGVVAALKGKSETLSLVLQMGGKVHTGDYSDYETVDRWREAKGAKFKFAPASVGPSGIFFHDYHIKVAVRDHAAMWLSSGNWQSSNQPDVDPLENDSDAATALRRYNREWHVILEEPELSKLYEAHILRDLSEAKAAEEAPPFEQPLVFVPADMPGGALEAAQKPRYFEPLSGERQLDIQPILTPDNYIDIVGPFIRSAKRQIYFQNQSFETGTVGGRYGELLDALLQKQRDGVDVRIIFRSFGSDDRDKLTNAKDYGFDPKTVRLQKNCHTKGIIVDGEAVLIGSHNWTTAGTGYNRDASLIFYDRDIAQFYQTLFLYDWNRVGPAMIDENVPAPIIPAPGAEGRPPPGYIAAPLDTILGL